MAVDGKVEMAMRESCARATTREVRHEPAPVEARYSNSADIWHRARREETYHLLSIVWGPNVAAQKLDSYRQPYHPLYNPNGRTH